MNRSFCLAVLAAMISCCPQGVQVDFLGPLQGENAGQSPFPYQGMDIYGDYLLSCQNRGVASVYYLGGDSLRLAGQWHLASFHPDNHANVVTFGLEKFQADDPLPLAYVSQCSKNAIDGKKDVLYVERITPDFSGSALVQTIFYDDVNHDFGYALQWVIDRKEKMLYGYGNTINNSDPDNRHRIIKFRLPKLSEGAFVTLRPEDALENYLIEEVSSFRFNPIGQGLYIEKGKLYMPTGVGKAETPSILYIWDLKKRAMKALDLSAVTTSEFEDISRYKDAFYIQAQDGIFRVKMGPDAGKSGFDWHDVLPRPVYDARPEYVQLYDKAWELAYEHIDTLPGIPSPVYLDEAHRSDRIWIWDTDFMAHFAKYCPSVFPGVKSLDNFYGILLADEDTPLPRVKGNRWCGKDEGKMLRFRIHHPDNPPLMAWTEYAYALQTGSKGRLKTVYTKQQYLQRWFQLFDSFDPSAPKPHGASQQVALKKYSDGYAWAGNPSGMDNSPRGRTSAPTERHRCPDNPDLRWLDALAQQGLSALCMSRIATLLGKEEDAAYWADVHGQLSALLNSRYWDEEDGFYYDIFAGGQPCKVPTIASWWPVLAEMSGPQRAQAMLAHLRNPEEFGGEIPTPSLSRADADFIPDGGYWRGSVWLPTTYMTLKAVDLCGDYALARETGSRLLECMWRTYADYEPHTIWECYSPSAFEPARDKKGETVRPDFCGWSALGPISVFLEDVIGIKQANAFERTLLCDFEKHPAGRVGVEGYRFGDIVCSVVATEKTVEVRSNRPFTLLADGKRFEVATGRNVFDREP